MNSCPICSGQLLTRTSSTGEDTWCSECRRVIASQTLDFNFKTADANIEQCSIEGLPGWKGPGAEAKCYVYEPGNGEQEEGARQKARASAYQHKKSSHIEKMAIAYFAGPTPDGVIDGTTTLDDEGVEVQPLSDQNKLFGLA